MVAGFAPLAVNMYEGGQSGGFSGVMNAASTSLTGYDLNSKKWDFGDMVTGWVPIIAGIVAHKLAGAFGLNAALGRYKIPLVRI